jgi:hypothetical protein
MVSIAFMFATVSPSSLRVLFVPRGLATLRGRLFLQADEPALHYLRRLVQQLLACVARQLLQQQPQEQVLGRVVDGLPLG